MADVIHDRQVTARDRVTYIHLELPRHAVILAERLPVESYLNTGGRLDFQPDGEKALFPDFAAQLAPDAALAWETRGAAALVMRGPEPAGSAKHGAGGRAAAAGAVNGAGCLSAAKSMTSRFPRDWRSLSVITVRAGWMGQLNERRGNRRRQSARVARRECSRNGRQHRVTIRGDV